MDWYSPVKGGHVLDWERSRMSHQIRDSARTCCNWWFEEGVGVIFPA